VSEPIDPSEQFGEHGEWDALAVGWALSALDPADEERFAEHLAGCARCTATVRESLYTVADLAYALPDEAPPPALKSRLMAVVAAEPRSPGGPGAPVEVGEVPEPQWPLGEPHPGTPGYGTDWFARPARPAEPDVQATQPPTSPGGPRSDVPANGRPAAPGDRPDRPGPTDREAASGPPDTADLAAGEAASGRPDLPAGDAAYGRPDQPDRAAGDAAYGRPDEQDEAAGAGYRGVEDEDAPLSGRHSVAEESAVPGSDAQTVVPLEPRRWGRVVAAGVAAAAAIALIAGLLVSNARLRDDQSTLRQVVAEREAAIKQLTANGPARVAALTANGQPSPSRKATLVVRGDQIEIIVEGLDATSPNQRYWLWTLRCDTPQPTDLKPIRGFSVSQPDFSVRDIGSDPGVASAPCFAISSEVGTATPKTPRQVVAVGQPS
jgi:hypothetical protein